MEITFIREATPAFADNEDKDGLIGFIEENEGSILSDYIAAWNAGWSLKRIGALGQAVRFLEHAMRLLPDKATGPYALAVVKAEMGEKLIAEAEDLYRASIRLKENWGARHGLAVLLLEHGRGEEGELLLREGVAAKPQSRVRHEEFADYLEDRGKFAEAEAVRRTASALPEGAISSEAQKDPGGRT